MQDISLSHDTVAGYEGGHVKTVILGSYNVQHDNFTGHVLQPFNVKLSFEGGEPLPGFGSNSAWASVLPWHDETDGFKEWDGTDKVQNGNLFIRKGASLEKVEAFVEYMDKRETGQLPDQIAITGGGFVNQETLSPGPASETSENVQSGGAPVEQPAAQPAPAPDRPHKHKHNQ